MRHVIFDDESDSDQKLTYFVPKSGERVVPNFTKQTLRKSIVIGEEAKAMQRIMVWVGIVLDGRTDLNIFDKKSVTSKRTETVLQPTVCLFLGAVGPDYILIVL